VCTFECSTLAAIVLAHPSAVLACLASPARPPDSVHVILSCEREGVIDDYLHTYCGAVCDPVFEKMHVRSNGRNAACVGIQYGKLLMMESRAMDSICSFLCIVQACQYSREELYLDVRNVQPSCSHVCGY